MERNSQFKETDGLILRSRTPTVQSMILRDSSIAKIAVEMTGHQAQFIEFNQRNPLEHTIRELCEKWNIKDPESYALKFSMKDKTYIQEKDKTEVKNGAVLQLTLSPAKLTEKILKDFPVNAGQAAQDLADVSTDVAFCNEFVEKKGLDNVIRIIETLEYSVSTESIFASLLPAFLDIMDHGIVQWDILEAPLIKKVASFVYNQNQIQNSKILQVALAILEAIIVHSGKHFLVEKELTIPNLAVNLQSVHPLVQQNTLALINAIFLRADDSKRLAIASTLNVRQIRNSILMNIIQKHGAKMTPETTHQLHVLQTSMLSLLEERMNTAVDPSDQDALDKVKELRKVAFDCDGLDGLGRDVTTRKVNPRDFQKLGFQNDTNPLEDFAQVPPGSLALDSMLYFARYHPEKYTRVVLENSGRGDEYDCPFARAAIELAKLLCEFLKIGEAPLSQNGVFYTLVFNHDHPFEELFCSCLVLVNKTWKEMRATVRDFDKVFSVVRDQIRRVLALNPSTQDEFKDKIATLTYAEITALWLEERSSREKWESQSRPVIELREQLLPEVVDLIERQRLKYMVLGTRFFKGRGGRSKEKYLCMKLSANHRTLRIGDCDESKMPSFDELPKKIECHDIKYLLTGKDCPHAKKKTAHHQYAFSIVSTGEGGEEISNDFVASDQTTFDYWVDGIHYLLEHKMNSETYNSDVEIILGTILKLKLLDVEGIVIPEEPIPIPREPLNYDFVVEKA